MARAAKLKVFRTAIGFHDAYVAAPSRKAALEAWGSDKDLFARGVAELVTDAELSAEPLARPGTVVKRLRGSAAEQLAALPPAKVPTAAKEKTEPKAPRPSRAALDAAEQAIADTRAEHERARRALEQSQRKELERLERARAQAEEAFEKKMRRWRGQSV